MKLSSRLIFLFLSTFFSHSMAQSELEEVRQAELKRNYAACINGYSSCNKSLLVAAQAEEAKQAELKRNYAACINGYSSCNKSLLVAAQAEEAKQAELKRNYAACINGYSSCDKNLLNNNLARASKEVLNSDATSNDSSVKGKNQVSLSQADVDAFDSQNKAIKQKELQVELEARRVAEERRQLDEEKRQREQEKKSSRIAVNSTATQPEANGDFTITIQTGADTASLKIDGEELGGKRDGNYVIKRVARVGEQNTYTITARDVFGNTDTKTISVLRQVVDPRPTFARLNPANIKPQPGRDAVAIIIGIQNYKLIPKAEYASQDAQDFYDYASRALGIKQENIKLLLNDEADVSGIYKAFQNWLPLKVRKGKTDVYVFYSGHGLPSADGKSLYFLPVGADKDIIAKTAISQREIVDALKSAQPKSVTMFIDSCYSGQIRTGETLLASARPVVLTVQETAYPPDFTVITASASDQIASSSPDLKHGIFSYYLMKGLEGEADDKGDGTITVGKLQSYLAEHVPRFALTMSRKQEPQLTGDANRVLVAR